MRSSLGGRGGEDEDLWDSLNLLLWCDPCLPWSWFWFWFWFWYWYWYLVLLWSCMY
jgi:hypothetical protein